jgi:hypothetical protein
MVSIAAWAGGVVTFPIPKSVHSVAILCRMAASFEAFSSVLAFVTLASSRSRFSTRGRAVSTAGV